jgi:extradiol dioxygenase family protein
MNILQIKPVTNLILLRSPGAEQRVVLPLHLTIVVTFEEHITWISRLHAPGTRDYAAKPIESYVGDMSARLNIAVLDIVDCDEVYGRKIGISLST